MGTPTHRHLKTGNYYRVIAPRAYDVTNGHEPMEVVVYQDMTGETFVRDAREFRDGRFEALPGD